MRRCLNLGAGLAHPLPIGRAEKRCGIFFCPFPPLIIKLLMHLAHTSMILLSRDVDKPSNIARAVHLLQRWQCFKAAGSKLT